jgi:hypothetical protein
MRITKGTVEVDLTDDDVIKTIGMAVGLHGSDVVFGAISDEGGDQADVKLYAVPLAAAFEAYKYLERVLAAAALNFVREREKIKEQAAKN